VLTSFREILEERRGARAAVGAFTCYDVTTAIGVVHAAEVRGDPVLLLVAEASFRSPSGRLLLPALLAVADAARVPACVQLDHVDDLELIDAALTAGAGAVMADGSKLPVADNASLVASVCARSAGAGVEAELGHVEGGEDVATATQAGSLTDPDEAVWFVAATGCDCLAVSIGNVHGKYARAPDLDWERLRAIQARVDVPLSLHGASGIADADLARAIGLGVCKVNVNTELRGRYLEQLEAGLPAAREGLRLLDLDAGVIDAVAELVAAKLVALAPSSAMHNPLR
jgi:tagatose 1,6-diphosphate aldolase GatY/KbaY